MRHFWHDFGDRVCFSRRITDLRCQYNYFGDDGIHENKQDTKVENSLEPYASLRQMLVDSSDNMGSSFDVEPARNCVPT